MFFCETKDRKTSFPLCLSICRASELTLVATVEVATRNMKPGASTVMTFTAQAPAGMATRRKNEVRNYALEKITVSKKIRSAWYEEKRSTEPCPAVRYLVWI